MRVETGSIEGYEAHRISYRMVFQETGSDCLAIILPGEGYSSQAPLLHYAAGVMEKLSYDYLQVNYQYNHEIYKEYSRERLVEAIRVDVNKVMDAALEKQSYQRYILIGKSLGTIAMSILLEREEFKQAKTVWLTPLLQLNDVSQMIEEVAHSGLCIIGEDDPWYQRDRFDKISKNPRIVSRLIPGADHSLQLPGKPIQSIEILKTVMEDIEGFCG